MNQPTAAVATRPTPSLFRDTRGTSALEYLIIAGLIAIFCLGAWRTFGQNARGRIQFQAGEVNNIR